MIAKGHVIRVSLTFDGQWRWPRFDKFVINFVDDALTPVVILSVLARKLIVMNVTLVDRRYLDGELRGKCSTGAQLTIDELCRNYQMSCARFAIRAL